MAGRMRAGRWVRRMFSFAMYQHHPAFPISLLPRLPIAFPKPLPPLHHRHPHAKPLPQITHPPKHIPHHHGLTLPPLPHLKLLPLRPNHLRFPHLSPRRLRQEHVVAALRDPLPITINNSPAAQHIDRKVEGGFEAEEDAAEALAEEDWVEADFGGRLVGEEEELSLQGRGLCDGVAGGAVAFVLLAKMRCLC